MWQEGEGCGSTKGSENVRGGARAGRWEGAVEHKMRKGVQAGQRNVQSNEPGIWNQHTRTNPTPPSPVLLRYDELIILIIFLYIDCL